MRNLPSTPKHETTVHVKREIHAQSRAHIRSRLLTRDADNGRRRDGLETVSRGLRPSPSPPGPPFALLSTFWREATGRAFCKVADCDFFFFFGFPVNFIAYSITNRNRCHSCRYFFYLLHTELCILTVYFLRSYLKFRCAQCCHS